MRAGFARAPWLPQLVLVLALAGAGPACDDTGEPFVLVDPCWGGPTDTGAPGELRCTGLYEDWESKRVAWDVRPFSPGTTLWSDGAEKQRWIRLPPGTTIDTSDVDQWRFPVGTQVWKQFSLGARKVETRLFAKAQADRWIRTTYVWSADGARAVRTDRGIANFEGTGYTVPSTSDCDKCHEGRLDRLLGFEAVGLAEPGAGAFNLTTLAQERRLTVPPDPAALVLPASIPAPTRAALSWLHVNCGVSCHNRAADSTAMATGLLLRLEAAQLAQAAAQGSQAASPGASALDPIRTTVGVRAVTAKWSNEVRVVAGAPAQSLLFRLATSRGTEQMPPIVSHLPDPEGTRILTEWIQSLVSPPGVATP